MIDELKTVVHHQQQKIAGLTTQIAGLTTQIAEQQLANTHQREINKNQQQVNKDLQKTITEQHQVSSELQEIIAEQQDNIRKLQERELYDNLKTGGDSTNNSQLYPVAFSAYNVDNLVWYEKGDTIPFTGVEYDSGYYDNKTSTFTCPVAGVYYFSINIYFRLDDSPNRGSVALKRGTETISHAGCWAQPDLQLYVTSTASVITRCEAGDSVHAEAFYTSEIYGEETGRVTSFTGSLLALG